MQKDYWVSNGIILYLLIQYILENFSLDGLGLGKKDFNWVFMHLQIIQGLAVTTSISLVDSPVSTKLNCQNNFLYSQNSSCNHLLQVITPSQ